MQRRNRSDLISRDFHCSCGKAYLSYPALHTHIKKYHEDPEAMLERVVIPKKDKLKRGRPINCKNSPVSAQFEELTFIETSVLKIYQEVSKDSSDGILLQGNEEHDLKTVLDEYKLRLRSEASDQMDLLTSDELEEYEEISGPLLLNLTKHFTVQVSVRLRVMLIVGFAKQQIEGAQREECVSKMAVFGWGLKHKQVAEVLYDVLMRALQQSTRTHDLISSNES